MTIQPNDPAFIEAQTLHEVHVTGKRLGRHVKHDPQSFLYPAPMAAIVQSVNHVRHVPIFNQGNLGSCTGESGIGCISTGPFTHQGTQAEAVQLYSDATKIDPYTGEYPPDDTGSNGLSVMQVLKKRAWIKGYTHVFDFTAFLRALVLRPGIVGMTWLTGGDSPDANGVIHYTGAVRGGHEVVAAEIDVPKRLIGFDNSWGVGFARSGRFYMTWDDAARALADHGDATFPLI